MEFSPHKAIPVERAIHGGITPEELRRLGLSPGQVIDFSANISPLGPSLRVREAVAKLDLSSYPDPQCLELREMLSTVTGVGAGQILIGNGSTELIHMLARAYLQRGDRAIILSPTFSEYEFACRLSEAEVVSIWAQEEDGFLWDIPAAAREIGRLKPRLVFLCNPNNPTGVYLGRGAVELLARAAALGLLVMDEAYISFVKGAWQSTWLLRLGNVVLLRSMTKDHALTGLRLGYALCPDEVAHTLALYHPAWSVNSAAQVAGVAALSDPNHLIQAKRCVEEARDYLQRQLQGMGMKALPSAANFLLVAVGDATAIRARLLSRGICVRDCSSFGLPQYIRVAVRTIPECRQLIEALRETSRCWGV